MIVGQDSGLFEFVWIRNQKHGPLRQTAFI